MGSNVSGESDTQAVLDGIRRIVHGLRESSGWAERQLGLSGAQLFVLQKLAEAPQLSVNELAERTHTHQSSVSIVVSKLVARGLVARTRSESDRRSVVLSLSPTGRRVAKRAPDLAQTRLVRGIDSLTPARRRQLASALGELAAAMRTADDAPAMFFEDRRGKARGARG